jgi:hypothetical protein
MSLDQTIEDLTILGLYPATAAGGADGNTVLYGTAAPTTEGVDGNFYIRTTTSFLYGPKAGGTWPAGVSMIGTLPSNAVVVNPVTGLFETNAGASIADAFVDTMTDALLLTGATYDDQSLIVKNPADNVANYFPAKLFRMNSRWYIENGTATLYAGAFSKRHTWPAATWVAGTLSSAAAGAQTTIDGGATLHALTAANQTTGLTTSIYISGSTGLGSIDWPIGWMPLAAIPNVNDLTVLYPYNANLRTPVITAINGGATEVLRIAIPQLSALGGIDGMVSVKNYIAANEHRFKVWICAAGTTVATLIAQTLPVTGLLASTNDTTASTVGTRFGMQNFGATNINVLAGTSTSATGLGLGTASAAYPLPGVQTNVPTELVVTFESSTGVDITMELVSLIVNWRY